MATILQLPKNRLVGHPGAVLRVLQAISRFSKSFFLVLWVNRVVILGLLALYLVLWKANQGQDLLVNLNSKFKAVEEENWKSVTKNFIGSNLGPALFYSVLTVMALLNWFLPKYFAQRNPAKITWRRIFAENWNYERQAGALKQSSADTMGHYVFISRLLGVLTFVIPAFAVLHVLHTYQIRQPLILELSHFSLECTAQAWMVLTVLVYWLLLYPFFDARRSGRFCRNPNLQAGNNALEESFEWLNKRSLSWLLLLPVVAMLGWVLWLGFKNTGHPQDLGGLHLGLLSLSLVLAIGLSVRRRLGCKRTGTLHRFWHTVRQYNLSAFILWSGVVLSAVFVLFNLLPFLLVGEIESLGLYVGKISRTTTLSVALTGIVFYIMIFSLLLLAGRKYRVNLVSFLLFGMVLAALLVDNEFHDVHTAPVPALQQRVSLEQHIGQWLEDREKAIAAYAPYGKYPIVLVNSHGGGIRAAAWMSLVVAHLDSVVASTAGPDRNGRTFQRHVLSFSGASGGTVGASVLTAFSKAHGGNYVVPSRDLLEFYQQDFLTPVVVGLLGRDVWFSTLGIGSQPDRALIQSRLWEKNLEAYAPGVYGQDYASLWNQPGGGLRTDIPLLFSNTYHLEKGQKAILTPVSLSSDDFLASVFVADLLGHQGKGVSLGTAAFLSARFPYVSPAGKLDAGHHFLDGGIRENSGAETSREVYTVLERVLQSRNMSDRVEVLCLSLDNEGLQDPKQSSKNVFELTAPAIGIYNVRVGNAAKAEAVNQSFFRERYFQLTPTMRTITLGNTKPMQPILPLGWQMSYPALMRLHASLKSTETQAKLAPLLKRITPTQQSRMGVEPHQPL